MRFFISKEDILKTTAGGIAVIRIPEGELAGSTIAYKKDFLTPDGDAGFMLKVNDEFTFNVSKGAERLSVDAQTVAKGFENSVATKYRELCDGEWRIENEAGDFCIAYNEFDSMLVAPKISFENGKLLANNDFIKDNIDLVYTTAEEEAHWLLNEVFSSADKAEQETYIAYLKNLKEKYTGNEWYEVANTRKEFLGGIDVTKERLKIDNYVNGKEYEQGVPFALRNRRQFIVWKWAMKDGKATKVPCNPRNFAGASSVDPRTWGTFEDCVNAINKHGEANQLAGIGIMFGRGLMGIDFDHCINNGVINPKVHKIIESIGSYAEYSPSGDGVHILVFGKKGIDENGQDYKCNNKPEGMECYDSGRFFTLTGKVYSAEFRKMKTVESTEVAVKAFLDEYMKKPVFQRQNSAVLTRASENELPDAEVISVIRKSLHKTNFEVLYDKGGLLEDKNGLYSLSCMRLKTGAKHVEEGMAFKSKAEQLRYYEADHSKQDMCLAGILAKYCNSPEQINRIFSTSALMRDKWTSLRGSDTYGERVCNTCFNQRTWVYDPEHYKRRFQKNYSRDLNPGKIQGGGLEK